MADTAKDFNGLGKKPNMEHRSGQFDVSKMPRTGGHVSSTCLALGGPVHHPLSGVHESTEFRTTPLHCVGVADAIRDGHRHPFLISAVQRRGQHSVCETDSSIRIHS